jgi:hypothetical protein
MARSPSYPQLSLPKAIDLVRLVYAGAHKSAIDSKTVMQLMNYSPGSGRALAVVGALKQYGLLEGRDESIRVTQLALSILEPLNENEKIQSLMDAATKPDLFADLDREFGDSIPSEAVIRSIAIRKHGFTNSGADNVVKSYLETMRFIKNTESTVLGSDEPESESAMDSEISRPMSYSQEARGGKQEPVSSNTLQFPISKDTTARVEFFGEISSDAIRRLIKHLELAIDIYE